MSLRVVHLGKYYPPARGGMESHVRTLAREQARLGLFVRVVVANHEGSRTVRERDGLVEVVRIGRLSSLGKLDVTFGVRPELEGADVVHLHAPNPWFTLAVLGARTRALVVTHHSDVVGMPLRAWLFSAIERAVYRRATVIATSEPYRAASPLLSRAAVVPLGIDLASVVLSPSEEKREEPVWLCGGRLAAYKGIDVAIRALEELPGRLVVVGEGPERPRLEQEAKRFPGRVELLGDVADWGPLFARATAFLFPSTARSEAFGLTQVEALAHGCPVVNTRIEGSGAPWVSRDGESGLTVPVGDPRALAAAARRLLDEPGLRERLAAGARERSRDFDARVMASRVVDVYRGALGRAASRTPERVASRAALRVLHLVAGNLRGGVESLLLTFARTPSRLEHAFGVFFDGPFADELRSVARVEVLGAASLRRPWTVLAARRRLRRVLRELRPDAVVAHGAWPHVLAGSAGRPRVLALHDLPSGHWLERLAARTRSELVVANSEATALAAKKLFRRVEVVRPAVPLRKRERAGELRAALGARDEVAIVLASRLERGKGHALLLDALALLEPRGWVAWIAGGPQRPHEAAFLEELRERARPLGERVRFLGHRSDVPELLAAADVHCQPNVRPDAFGLAFVEALAAGLPVVTTPLGGAREIVDATCGVLVEPSPRALARALQELVADEALRRRLGAAGPGRARQLCDPGPRLAEWHELIASLL